MVRRHRAGSELKSPVLRLRGGLRVRMHPMDLALGRSAAPPSLDRCHLLPSSFFLHDHAASGCRTSVPHHPPVTTAQSMNSRSETVHGLRVTCVQREATVMAETGLPCRMTGPHTGSIQSGGRIPERISARKAAVIP